MEINLKAHLLGHQRIIVNRQQLNRILIITSSEYITDLIIHSSVFSIKLCRI